MKATFNMSLISRKDLVSISNTPVANTFSSDGIIPSVEEFCISGLMGKSWHNHGDDTEEWTVTQFATTPKMSMYLLAYATGDFKYLESSFISLSGETIPVRFYALEDQIEEVFGVYLTF